MARYNPTTLVKMNQGGMTIEQYIAHCQRAHYLGTILIDSNRECARLQRDAGVLYPISRIYPWEPRPDNDNPDHIRAYARERYQDLKNLRADAQSPNVIYQVNNERGFVERDFRMYIELIKLSVADPQGPIGLCFWNGASGAVRTGFWGQENEWKKPWAIEFLKLMHEHRNVRLESGAYAFMLGVHNYTSQYPTIATNAGQDRKVKGAAGTIWDRLQEFVDGKRWINWRLAQDHIGRDFQGIMLALGWEVTADGKHFIAGPNTLKDSKGDYVFCCWLVDTEVGYDNMADVANVHRDELVMMSADGEPYVSPYEAYRLTPGADYVPVEGENTPLVWAEGVQQSIDDEYIPATQMEQAKAGAYGVKLWLFTLLEWLEKFWLTLVVWFTGELWFVRQALDTPRGYRSLVKTWAQSTWLPGKAAGYILGFTMRWKWRTIHAQTEVTIFQALFCEGQTSAQWVSYNVFGDTDYIKFAESEEALEEIPAHFLQGATVPPPPPPASTDPTLPKANDGRWFDPNFAAWPARAWIYSHRDTGSAKLGYLQSASATDYSQKVWTIYNPRLGMWRAVKLNNGVIGWVDETLINFKPDTPPFNITAQDERWRRHNIKVIGTLPVKLRAGLGDGEVLKEIQPGPTTSLDMIPLSMLTDWERSFLERGSEKGAIDYYVFKLSDGRIAFAVRAFLDPQPAITVTIPQFEYLQLKADLELAQKRADSLAFDLMAEQDKRKLDQKRIAEAGKQAVELQATIQEAAPSLIEVLVQEITHHVNNKFMPAQTQAGDLVSDLTEES
jgi:hypothetical protein